MAVTGTATARTTIARTTTRRRRLLASATALAAALVVLPGAGAAAQPGPAPVTPTAAGQAAVAEPDAALGAGWRGSTDVLVTGVGDTNGFHVYLARESTGFAWSTVATLNAGLTGLGTWIGYTCVTGSGRYAAVVFAPGIAVNKPRLMKAGAFAAVVDLATGTARRVTSRLQLAYFNPACGPGDRVLLTRSYGEHEEQTDLITVDAKAGMVTGSRRVRTQLTTPVPAVDGDYGVAGGKLVRVDAAGRVAPVATPAGRPAALAATAAGAIDVLSVAGDRAVAQRYAGGTMTRLGTAPWNRLQLFSLAGGRSALVGDVTAVPARAPDLLTVHSARQVAAVSRQGHLLAEQLLTEQAANSVKAGGAAVRPEDAGRMHVTVRATHSGRATTGTVSTDRKPAADAPTAGGKVGPVAPGARSQQPGAAPSGTAAPGGRVTAAAEPPPVTQPPKCAVPRNNINRQVLQPSYNQVEWAVDRGVHGQLDVLRAANRFRNGLPAYRPQTMFPMPAGSVRVPANLMLGILAQETNLAQASWHAVPGDAGNPLIADYYGNGYGGSIEVIDYASADCGYGIAQVTTGMAAADATPTADKKTAIATDYAVNILAGMNILIDKWNQVAATGSSVNGGDWQYIENWFLAVWGYNSGVYPVSSDGRYGVGWFNNPANPRYPVTRDPFLRFSLDDARRPAEWPYQEKVMGWTETPQWQWTDSGPIPKYSKPTYSQFPYDNGNLALPNRLTFCGNGNACNPANSANPCPNNDNSCWWHGTVTWTVCATSCARENAPYAAQATEPTLQRTYPTSCTPFQAKDGGTVAAVVEDLTDSANNLLGCAGRPWGGKFTLRTGHPSGLNPSHYGQVDLHQIGAGYLGHAWFSHTYLGDDGPPTNAYHQVVGTWTPSLTQGGNYEIVVHLPSHGANTDRAVYVMHTGHGGNPLTCTVNQDVTNGSDTWVSLGWSEYLPGAKIQLSNVEDFLEEGEPDPADPFDGTVDIAWDAVAFVKLQTGYSPRSCGDVY